MGKIVNIQLMPILRELIEQLYQVYTGISIAESIIDIEPAREKFAFDKNKAQEWRSAVINIRTELDNLLERITALDGERSP